MTTLAATAAASALVLAACGDSNGDDEAGNGTGEGETLVIAAFEGYGEQLHYDVAEAFQDEYPDVEIELTVSSQIEDEITPQIQAGSYPDLVFLGQGRAAGLTESFIREQSLEELSDVLDMQIPGEDVTVGDKLQEGMVDNLGTNPYGDDRLFLMPLNYSPTGLVYDQGLFANQGWDLPETWDEMFELGDTARDEEDIWLMTYPTAGYLDSYFPSLLAGIGGEELFEAVMTYEQDVWQTPEAAEAIELTTELLTEHLNPTTVGYANEQDFNRNQQQITDRDTLFMPNGTWISNELADAPRDDDFEWGIAPLPALEAGQQQYITTSIENVWMPDEAANKDLAKEYIAFLYSDAAVEIHAEYNAIQPVEGVIDLVPDEQVGFYEIYDDPNVQAVVGRFAATPPVEAVNIASTLYESANSVASGDTTAEEWLERLHADSERLREALEAEQD